MNNISVENYGLSPMTQNEQFNYSGGGLLTWIAAGVSAFVEAPVLVTVLAVGGTIDAAYSFGKGVVTGWNSVH